MDKNNRHIIQKVRAELTVPRREKHTERSEQFKQAVQNAIEKAVAVMDFESTDRFYQIDFLSIELDISGADFQRLEKQLETALSEKISHTLNGRKSELSMSGVLKNEIKEISPGKRHKELISYFLKTGRLPWWAEPVIMSKAENWLEKLPANEWTEFIESLMQNNSNILERLATQFPASLLHRLIKKIAVEKYGSDAISSFLKKLLKFARNQNLTGNEIHRLEAELFEDLFEDIMKGADQKILLTDMSVTALTGIAESPAEEDDSQIIFKKWKFYNADKPIPGWNAKLENDLLKRITSGKQIHRKKERKEEQTGGEEFRNSDENLRAFHSGIVILYPFLESLFVNLGLMENGTFLNRAARERAVCLVHYLATGKMESPEHELLLHKFLCGWPLEKPVKRFATISDYEKTECESLLTSTIQHWEALKNTSVKGLRESFLQREGILKKEEFGWNLYIEELTQDVLLQKLPWGISIIKLKWMDEMLSVQWSN
ncbi:hypothetical protein BH23BAC3_BH23BAC3_07690 [soil metagenome]